MNYGQGAYRPAIVCYNLHKRRAAALAQGYEGGSAYVERSSHNGWQVVLICDDEDHMRQVALQLAEMGVCEMRYSYYVVAEDAPMQRQPFTGYVGVTTSFGRGFWRSLFSRGEAVRSQNNGPRWQ